jgi:hypothetical protein
VACSSASPGLKPWYALYTLQHKVGTWNPTLGSEGRVEGWGLGFGIWGVGCVVWGGLRAGDFGWLPRALRVACPFASPGFEPLLRNPGE